MTRSTYFFLGCSIYCMLIGFSHEVALIGKRVRDAKLDEFLFVVSIAHKPLRNGSFENLHFCTGSLISRKSVLTCAHCLIGEKKEYIEIIAGSADLRLGDKYYPDSWITYEEWQYGIKNNRYSINDIAIITLKGEGVTNPKVKPTFLSFFTLEDMNYPLVRIAGWGEYEDGTKPIVMKTAILRVYSRLECDARASTLINEVYYMPEHYFCSLARPWVLSSCGDSGAPILNKQNQQIAINVGVCPTLPDGYPTEFLNQNQHNSHLHLHHFRHFIRENRI